MTEITDQWGFTEKLNDPKYKPYYDSAVASLKETLSILDGDSWKNKTGWTLENERSGDKAYSKSGVQKKGKTFVATGEFNINAEDLLRELWDNIEGTPSWNPTILEYKKLLAVGLQTDVAYNAFADLLGGIVKSRDFVDARCWRKVGNAYCLSAQSIEFPEMPPQKSRVRGEDSPGIFRIHPIDGKPGKCTAEFVMNTDLKGYLLKSVVEKVTHGTMLDYFEHLRKRVAAITAS